MTIISRFKGHQRTIIQSKDKSKRIAVDITNSWNPYLSATAATSNIEDGSNITHNIIKKPLLLTLQCFISEREPSSLQSAMSGNISSFLSNQVRGAIGSKGGAISASVLASSVKSLNNSDSRVKDSIKEIQKIFEAKQIVSIISDIETYENMIITEFSPTSNQSTGSGIDFTLKLTQINFVSTKTVFIDTSPKKSKEQIKTASKNANKANIGSQPTKEVTKSSSSALKNLLGGF